MKNEREIPLTEIDGIEIGLYRVGAYGHDHVRAETLLDAQMSAPCAVVLALTQDQVSVQGFEPKTFAQPLLQDLLSKTRVYVDEDCEALYPGRRSGVIRIRLLDGRVLEKRVIDPRGEGANPLTDDELIAKFTANCQARLGTSRTEAIISQVMSYDRQVSSAELFQLLR